MGLITVNLKNLEQNLGLKFFGLISPKVNSLQNCLHFKDKLCTLLSKTTHCEEFKIINFVLVVTIPFADKIDADFT